MAFRFFENAVNSNAQQMPNDMYRDIQQEYINMQWDNTSAMITIQEQVGIGLDEYNDIEVWITSSVADTTTGLKDNYDFNKFVFKDINHRVVRGLMYQFDNNYWIVHAYTPYNGLAQDCGVRRCNNRLKIVNPENGKVEVFPCCVDYDMTSPSQQTSRYIITPNNHAVVMVQGNDLTLKLLKTNKRFILSGRPFKLLAYQNAVEYSEEEQQSTLLYLDLYLDEIRDGDDLENGIADNGEFDYSIQINGDDMTLTNGAIGQLQADVTLNGKEVVRDIVWESSDKAVVTIDEDGVYEVVGAIGDNATISAHIVGNDSIVSEIDITVSNTESIEANAIIDPMFSKIRQYDSETFNIKVEYNGETYTTFDTVDVELIGNKDYAQLVSNTDGSYTLTGLNISKSPMSIRVHVTNISPAFDIDGNFDIQVVSMMG